MGETANKELLRRDFILNGNLWKVILRISFPLILLNALNYIYGLIDTVMVANIGKLEVSAVVVLDQIKNMLSAIAGGLATGGTIYVARLIGANNYAKAKKVANTVVAIALSIGLGLAALIIPLARPLLRLLQTPESLIEIGSTYFIIQIASIVLTLFNSIYLGLEKARGNTKYILYLNVGVMIVKIILTALFVYVFKWGINMVAAATLIAHGLLTAYCLLMFLSKKYLFSLSFKKGDVALGFVKPIVALAFPIFLGKFVFSLGKVVINTMCGYYGDTVVGALGISNHMGGSVTNILGSVEESESTIIGQNLGNGNKDRAVRAFWYSLILNLSLSVVGVILLTAFNSQIISYFSKGDVEFGNMINNIFRYEKIGIVALAINSAVLGLLYGFGFTKVSMVMNLSRLFVFRIPSLYILMNFTSLGEESVGIAMMISNVGIGLMALIVAFVYMVKIKRKDYSADNIDVTVSTGEQTKTSESDDASKEK